LTGDLPDVNVLLALAWPNHQFHERASSWYLTQGSDGWSTCSITQLGFIRLSSNPSFTPYAKTPLESTMLLSDLVSHPGHRFIKDAPAATSKTFLSVAKHLQGHKQTTDAYLMAIAKEHGLKLVTFDRRLDRYCPFDALVRVLST